MNSEIQNTFDVLVDASRKGDANSDWSERAVAVSSIWDRGSEQEKFEVLSAIRRTYNPGERADIRGDARQTPDQIARSEGFTSLRYRYAASPLASVVVVRALGGYSRLQI